VVPLKRLSRGYAAVGVLNPSYRAVPSPNDVFVLGNGSIGNIVDMKCPVVVIVIEEEEPGM